MDLKDKNHEPKELSIIIIDYYQVTNFFLNLSKSDTKRDYEFITTSLSSYLKLLIHKEEVTLISKISKPQKIEQSNLENLNIKNTREYVLKLLSEKEISSLYSVINTKTSKIIDSKRYEKINLVTWNGSNVIGESMRNIKKNNEIVNTIFLEISNIHSKIFRDNYGVNAKSDLFLNIDILDNYETSNNNHDEWASKFISNKIKSSFLPQEKTTKKLQLWHLVDFIYLSIFGYTTFNKTAVKNKLTSKLLPKNKITYSKRTPEKFVFFPMQVSTDTQIRINSEIDNLTALKKIIKNETLPIVIKPHPAEPDIDYIIKFINENKDRIHLTKNNTYQLIQKSSKVITINSTVGLEAMIFNKPVEFYGRSIFEKFNKRRLSAYIHNHLINIDFFKNKPNDFKENIIEKIYRG